MADTSRVITAVCWSLRPWYFVLGHPNNPVPEVRAQVRDLPEQNLCWACNPVCLKIWEVVLVLLGVFCRRFREIIHGGFSRWQQMGNHRSLQKSDGSRRERNRWADWVAIPETYLTGSSKQDFRICPLLPPSNQNFYEAHLAQIHLLGGQLRVIPARIRSLWPQAKGGLKGEMILGLPVAEPPVPRRCAQRRARTPVGQQGNAGRAFWLLNYHPG